MKLLFDIEDAFSHRKSPSQLIENNVPITPEQKDALWFMGRDWRDISVDAWNDHPDAFYSFVPRAFSYFLPSILTCSLRSPGEWLHPLESLLGVLDRSPEVSNWDEFMTERLLGLESREYEVIKDWLLSLSGRVDLIDDDGLARAYETVDLLARETLRVGGALKE